MLSIAEFAGSGIRACTYPHTYFQPRFDAAQRPS
jgi:hypothetical protein